MGFSPNPSQISFRFCNIRYLTIRFGHSHIRFGRYLTIDPGPFGHIRFGCYLTIGPFGHISHIRFGCHLTIRPGYIRFGCYLTIRV